jgi:hypothetical protein
MSAKPGTSREPRWHATPEHERLARLAAADTVASDDDRRLFLTVCKADAQENDGRVSPNRIAERIRASGVEVHPQWYASMWSANVGPGKPMIKLEDEWEITWGSKSGNNGKPRLLRLWVSLDAGVESSPVALATAA